MTDDGADKPPPAVALDDEGKRLQLGAEKAKYRQTIAAANQAAAASVLDLPEIPDAPTGTVTLGEKAGAFGPWLAHKTLQSAAEAVGEAVADRRPQGRLLVVDDRSLIGGAATARLVRDRLARLTVRLATLPEILSASKAGLPGDAQIADLAAPAAEGAGEGAGEEAGDEASAPPAAGGTLGAAVDLLSLVRTDYTLAAATVNTSPSELTTLTAAVLAGKVAGLTVEVDGFTAAVDSRSLAAVDTLARARDTGLSALATLEARLAPIETELATLRTRTSHLEDSWESWAAAKDANRDGGAALRRQIDIVSALVAERAAIAGQARSIADHARGVLTEADTALAALLQPAGNADSPLVTAVRWERLGTGTTGVNHILFVDIDQFAADAVTRRSVLGTSGRLTFLGAVTISWLLLDSTTGAVQAGGSAAPTQRLLLDLESGKSSLAELGALGTLSKDPLRMTELAATIGVLLIAAFLAILAVVAAIRLVLG